MREVYIEEFDAGKGVRVVKISGSFTKETTPNICEKIKTQEKTEPIKGILLDAKDISEVDTSAFACLISIIKDNVAAVGTKVAVINLKDKGKHLSEILKVDNIVNVFDTEEKALEFFSS